MTRWDIEWKLTDDAFGPFTKVVTLEAPLDLSQNWHGFDLDFYFFGPIFGEIITELTWKFSATSCNFTLDVIVEYGVIVPVTSEIHLAQVYKGPKWFYYDSGLQATTGNPGTGRLIGHTP
jgi:hypothetical protein